MCGRRAEDVLHMCAEDVRRTGGGHPPHACGGQAEDMRRTSSACVWRTGGGHAEDASSACPPQWTALHKTVCRFPCLNYSLCNENLINQIPLIFRIFSTITVKIHDFMKTWVFSNLRQCNAVTIIQISLCYFM